MSRVQSLLAVFLCLQAVLASADSTWVYAVQLSATVQTSPAAITLTWPQDMYGALSYTVSRKLRNSSTWTPLATLDGGSTSFTDYSVSVGSAYEYEVFKQAQLGYTGTGYIYAGVQAPATESRGKLVLVAETNATAPLSAELARLESDLVGDGWSVVRKSVSSNQTPQSVKGLITAEYYGGGSPDVRAVLLFGHVPIFFSGSINWDTHGARAMPADGWYGDMDGDWSSSPSYFPSAVELVVGRVDLANMPGVGASSPWPSETELLRNYLEKDHRWRHGQVTVQRRSLMANRRGDEGGGAAAACAYRDFETFTGHGNTVEANVQDNAPVSERWISRVCNETWLWTYGCGGGQPIGLSGLGTHGIYNDVYSTDLRGQGAKAVFYMLFGSWIADWQLQDDFLRAALATPEYGLASCLAGRPHWYNHTVGLGEPIGYGALMTMNNTTLYRSYSNALAGGIYVSLLGDPALRMDPVVPPSGLTVASNGSTVQLTWSRSPDSVVGTYVYRSPTATGPFTRITSSPLTGTTFSDTPPAGNWTYMIRALKLQVGASGSYYNLSQGIFGSTGSSGGGTITNSGSLVVRVVRGQQGPTLVWPSELGKAYRVQGNLQPTGQGWVTLTGPISSESSTCTWTDPNGFGLPMGYYRVVQE